MLTVQFCFVLLFGFPVADKVIKPRLSQLGMNMTRYFCPDKKCCAIKSRKQAKTCSLKKSGALQGSFERNPKVVLFDFESRDPVPGEFCHINPSFPSWSFQPWKGSSKPDARGRCSPRSLLNSALGLCPQRPLAAAFGVHYCCTSPLPGVLVPGEFYPCYGLSWVQPLT